MHKKRILFFIESLEGGGAEKVLTTLVRHINKELFDVTVCAISGGGKYEEDVRNCCKYHTILHVPTKKNKISTLLYALKHHLVYKWLPLSLVYRLFVPKDNDVEIAFVEGFATKLLSHSINKKAKKYAWVHCNIEKHHWTKSVYKSIEEETICYNKYNYVIGVAETVEQAILKEFPALESKTATLYNVVDSSNIYKQADQKTNLPKEHFLLVTVGRLEKPKAYDRLLRVTHKLLKNGFSIELWIIGDGTLKEELGNYIYKSNLQQNIKLLGFHSNPYKYLVQGDLFVCSSLSEGYSTAVTEALILGLPVVTTDCSGMSELLKDGECGLITDNNEEALYEGLKKVLSDKILYSRYKEKAILRGQDFTIETLVKPVENLLLQ